MNNMAIPAKEELENKYLKEGKPIHLIAEELKMSVGKIYNFLKKYKIPTRTKTETLKGRKLTPEQCERISKMHKGKRLSAETKKKISEGHKQGGIGAKKKRSDGYIAIYFPDHPHSTKDGYIMEHVLIMECLIGRHLKDNECVHHINFNREDNRKENLQLMTKSEHMSLHSKKDGRNIEMLNTAILMGRLTADPTLKTLPSGKVVANFSLAVQRKFAREGQPQADFINCVAWGNTATFICNYFEKGKMIAVQGEIQTRTWEDGNHKKQYATEVVVSSAYFTGGKNDTDSRADNGVQPMPDYNSQSMPNYDEFQDISDGNDDLPF